MSSSTRIKSFPFSCAYACVCAATRENEIPLKNDTSTRIFTTPGFVWARKILDPDYFAPKQFGRFGWFCLCLFVRRISFLLSDFSRVDWLIFIINKSADGQNFNLCKLSSSTFSCQTVNFFTNDILWTFLGSQSKTEISYLQCSPHFEKNSLFFVYGKFTASFP